MNSDFFKTSIRVATIFALAGGLLGLPSPVIASVRAAPGDRTLISVSSSGGLANAQSYSASVSGDGRFVAFVSDADNLVVGDTNGEADIFVRDRQAGTTTIVSVDSTGALANASSDQPSISSDGRYVAFQSDASNLAGGDTNGATDIFVRDRQASVTTLVSIDPGAVQLTAASEFPDISAGGRYVTWESGDIYVRDLQTATTTIASVDSGGGAANAGSSHATVSTDGRFVAFLSVASNLVTGDTNGHRDVFVRDRQSGSTLRASVSATGLQINGSDTSPPEISDDGRFVSFITSDDTVVTTDTYLFEQVYVRDLQTNETKLVTIDNDGFAFVGRSGDPTISADGRVVAFQFNDADSIPDFEVMAQDRQLGVSDHASGSSQFTGAGSPAMSGDGRFVAFTSSAVLVPGDTNGLPDIYLRELAFVANPVPTVAAVTRADPDPTSALALNFNVTFSEPVTGVDVTDFAASVTGDITGATVSNVSGSGAAYLVTVNITSGSGTLRLDVLDNDNSIEDASHLHLGGWGAGNGSFSSGESYTIDVAAPVVTGSLRADPSPSAAASVHFTVNFSESVSGVDVTDFALTNTGVSGASLTTVSGSGTTYTVTVGTGTGSGTIRLDVVDNDTILDGVGNALGGPGAGNGSFTTGEIYSIEKVPGTITPPPPPTATPRPPVLQTARIRSNGLNDGWVLESSEDSGQGGTKKSNGDTIRIGDDSGDRQYRGILHFPTSSLPDNAVITMAILTFKQESIVGTDPFTTHQNIAIDIRSGPFGSVGPFGINGLQVSDFQAPANMSPAGIVLNNPVGGWYWALLDGTALQFINAAGVTQFRLAFQLDDNDDLGNDYLSILSGDAVSITDRPHLVITYYAP